MSENNIELTKETELTPVILTTQIACRFKAGSNEAEILNELIKKLHSQATPANTMSSAFWLIVDAAQKFVNGTPATVNKEIEEEYKKKIGDLNSQLEKYTSINITQLETDNLELRNENETIHKQIIQLTEEFENFKIQVTTDSGNFDSEHYSIRYDDQRLTGFFSGANMRISNKTPNRNGRITKEYEDVIEDLVILAQSAAKRNIISNKEGF